MNPKSKSKNINRKRLLLTTSNTPLSQSDYTFALTQIAVSQICQSIGFTTTTLSTLKTLTHITTLYLQTLAKTSLSYSNHSNRTQPNLIDLVQALNDIAGVHGFTGASVLHETHNPFCSKLVKDLSFFVDRSKEIPFAKPVSIRCENENWVKADTVKKRRGMHIPEWLPGFPEENSKKREDENGSGGEMVSCSSVGEERKGNSGGELGKERGIVRFRIEGGKSRREGNGKEMLGGHRTRSGVCIGGKRVCWNYLLLHIEDQEK